MLTDVKKDCLDKDFELGEVIGDGSFGKIRKARNRYTDEVVAIKVIDKSLLKKPKEDSKKKSHNDKEEEEESKKEKKKDKKDKNRKKSKLSVAEEGLLREINILKLCQHPHIVHYIACYEDEKNYYIVMEYIKDGDAVTLLNNKKYRRVKERKAKDVIAQLQSAVEYCHRNLIAHRDIKLDNILIADKDKLVVKLADFGLSNFINPESNHFTFCGTLNYAAPEIIMNDDNGYDPMKVDVWSLGVVIYVMIAGRFPWEGKSVVADATHIASCINFPQKFKINYPDFFSEDLKDLLGKIFRKPEDRMTVIEIKQHPWLVKHALPSYMKPREPVVKIEPIFIAKVVSLGFNEADVLVSVYNNTNNQMTALYHIIKERYGDVIEESIKISLGQTSNDFSRSDPSIYARISPRRGSPRRELTPRQNPISRILDEEMYTGKNLRVPVKK